MSGHLHLAVALDGTGWHPASWREETARPLDVFGARYWTDLVTEAERGLLDFVTFEDALDVWSQGAPGGRLDAVLIAARVAPATSRIGLMPTATTTHTEPFHVAIGVATLDHVSGGRAGWRPQVSSRAGESAHFGRRDRLPGLAELLEEAGDAVEVARRLWDSWEDGAEIRDAVTGRFIDRDRLHHIDFEGRWFSVRGPSITPRPPQGQPPVAVLAHSRLPYELAARSADVVFVTPYDREDARRIVAEVRGLPRTGEPLKVFADIVVFLGADAAERKARLDDLDGVGFVSDAAVFAGTAEDLADLLLDWREAGIDGFRLRPGRIPIDLKRVARGVTSALRRRGAFRAGYEADTLRGLLGLPRPASRYATGPAVPGPAVTQPVSAVRTAAR
ncbi:LLM class flavin-dependent oxidoreductase [Spongiactinospora sp. TRM90649]|uniref:LLM class flavin-dependent oxidoreductase n=1 Tax=Spongiactinospora sp. TRM90649 TaxID=3031114 RepID=UPI0023F63B29|nr:LLM class flavin-dependent oxidoreductase [Spongiactinospora sp. TRM90649]MDF5758150.1 LLM class flavin-dependent oxidoreductase [Spongiactinospora sp. TRM90649]